MAPLLHQLKQKLKKNTVTRKTIVPLARRVIPAVHRKLLERIVISRRDYLDDLRAAIEKNRGYAAGKLGVSQKYWMYYKILLEKENDPDSLRRYEETLAHHGLKQCGVFPADRAFYLKFNDFYVPHVKNLDCIGLFLRTPELEIIKYYQLKNKFIFYPLQEPDRSSPNDEKNCYLQFFRDKKILLVCPFAGILKERATRETFESVWSKTGKKWFYPLAVDSLEFPYGFSKETQKRYPTALELYKHIIAEIDNRDFDIALVAASGLAIPIVSHIKNRGKVAIDLGGHLQIIFGVLGKRWRTFKGWDRLYFNDSWIDMPAEYRPKETDVCDKGAYW
jgi:hypothetical protein